MRIALCVAGFVLVGCLPEPELLPVPEEQPAKDDVPPPRFTLDERGLLNQVPAPPSDDSGLCDCEPDADTCDRIGDSVPSSTDICQTWSNIIDGRVNLFVELDSDAPLTGLSPAILGFQFDLDFDAATTPERCSGCAHGFVPHPDDELGDEQIWIGFEEYIYLQPYLEQDGTHLLDLSTTFEVDCADVRRAGRVFWVSFPRERIDAEAFRLSAYTYGDYNALPYPDLASGTELFYESNSGAPDIEPASFSVPEDFLCVPRLN